MKREVEFTVATDTDDESLLDMMARVGVTLAQFSVDKHVPLMFTTHIYDIVPDGAEYPLVCNNPAEELIVLAG